MREHSKGALQCSAPFAIRLKLADEGLQNMMDVAVQR